MNDMMLYDYQEDMLRRIERAFETCRSVMVQMPAGTGKTVLLAAVVSDCLRERRKAEANDGPVHAEKTAKPCVWVVVHRKELVEQIEHALAGVEAKGKDEGSSLFRFGVLPRVMSIQWLSRHCGELAEKPALIVIDEAHHALARTYAEVTEAFPHARILGVTATPCRMTRHGFGGMFDVLLQSWSMERFIAEGRLSLYDYMSVRDDSDDLRIVCGLQKRGADGDFSLREMSARLDVRPSIERLCDTVLRYAAGMKGIVYAIDIAHAEHIAAAYRRHGIGAAAISSRTPADERRRMIESFRNTSASFDTRHGASGAGLSVLVNVDLFGEGFDCPDVEFIQLARPTLSLAKYLQQVGRGMRVFGGKKYCLILDNVGLYRIFGLPSDDRDWQAMFSGRIAGKGRLPKMSDRYDAASAVRDGVRPATDDGRTELITVMTHDGQRMSLDAAFGYSIAGDGTGLVGVADSAGREVLPCIYGRVELKGHGFARLHSRRKADRERPWIDLRNGVRFVRQPHVVKAGFMTFSTTDGTRLYPRVLTRMMGETDFVMPDALAHGIDGGLRFGTFYVQPSEPSHLYRLRDRMDGQMLFDDESGALFCKDKRQDDMHRLSMEEWEREKDAWQQMVADFERRAQERQKTGLFGYLLRTDTSGGCRLADYAEPAGVRISRGDNGTYSVYCRETPLGRWKSMGTFTQIFNQAYGIRVVRNWEGRYLLRTKFFERFDKRHDPQFDYAELQDGAWLYITDGGKSIYVDLESKMCFDNKPQKVAIGPATFLKDGDMYFPTDYRLDRCKPYRRGEIADSDYACFVGKTAVLIKGCVSVLYIRRRYVDGCRFVVAKSRERQPGETLYNLYCDGKNPPEISVRTVG